MGGVRSRQRWTQTRLTRSRNSSNISERLSDFQHGLLGKPIRASALTRRARVPPRSPCLFALRGSLVFLVGHWILPVDGALVDRQLQRVLIRSGAVPVLDARRGPPRLTGEHLLDGAAAHLRACLSLFDHQ